MYLLRILCIVLAIGGTVATHAENGDHSETTKQSRDNLGIRTAVLEGKVQRIRGNRLVLATPSNQIQLESNLDLEEFIGKNVILEGRFNSFSETMTVNRINPEGVSPSPRDCADMYLSGNYLALHQPTRCETILKSGQRIGASGNPSAHARDRLEAKACALDLRISDVEALDIRCYPDSII